MRNAPRETANKCNESGIIYRWNFCPFTDHFAEIHISFWYHTRKAKLCKPRDFRCAAQSAVSLEQRRVPSSDKRAAERMWLVLGVSASVFFFLCFFFFFICYYFFLSVIPCFLWALSRRLCPRARPSSRIRLMSEHAYNCETLNSRACRPGCRNNRENSRRGERITGTKRYRRTMSLPLLAY